MKRIFLPFVAATILHAGISPQDRAGNQSRDEFAQTGFVTKNRAALERIFHDELSYGHWKGTVENKTQAVQQISANLADFEGMDITNAVIRAYGDIALVHCTMDIHEVVNGEQNLNHLVVLHKSPGGWQLVARQSVGPPIKH